MLPARGNIYFVQFEARPSDLQRERVAELGGIFYSYVPDHAYLVRMDPQSRESVSELPCVRWVGPFRSRPPFFRPKPMLSEAWTRGARTPAF